VNGAQLAAELVQIADGADAVALEAGIELTWPCKVRDLAREHIRLLHELEDERSARKTIQAQRDQALAFLGERAYRHIMRTATSTATTQTQ